LRRREGKEGQDGPRDREKKKGAGMFPVGRGEPARSSFCQKGEGVKRVTQNEEKKKKGKRGRERGDSSGCAGKNQNIFLSEEEGGRNEARR